MMIDWQQVVLNLRRHYTSTAAVGRKLKIDWHMLNRLARGEIKEPKFSVGMKLLDLHYDKCKDLHHTIKGY